MKAVVMAGGEGTRLRPLTSNQPKPMVPVVNKPAMEYIIELLKKYEFIDIVATLQFLPQLIKNYFGEGGDLGVNLAYAIEEHPLGTAGSVKNAEKHLGDDTFIVVSGDALTDINLSKAVQFHKSKKALATLVLKAVENPLEFGIVVTDKGGRIERFLEKPTWGGVFSDTVNTGIYILGPEVFDYIPEDSEYDFSKDLFPLLLRAGQPLYGYVASGYWCDIGNFQQYLEVHQSILDQKTKLHPSGIKMQENIWVGEGADIHPTAEIKGPVVIGQHASIGAGAKIGEYSIIGNNVLIKENVRLHRAIIWDNSYIGPQARLQRAIVGRSCDIKSKATVEQGVVIGDECVIGSNAIINHDVKIYPFKRIDDSATVNTSIIWESRGMRTLFGKEGVSGLINIDITADLAVRLAMAFGTALKKGSQVVTSRDFNRISRLIKRAVDSGLNSTGINVRDLRIAPAPLNRFNVRTTRCEGGLHIRVSPHDPQMLEMNFYDSEGINIGEGIQRNVEKYFYREDFRRAFYAELGEIIFPARTSEFYTSGVLRVVDRGIIRSRNFKVIVDYAYGSACLVMPSVMGKLGCDVITLNSTADESRVGTSYELGPALDQLSRTVKIFKADFGVLMDKDCEKIYLVDDKGRPVSLDDALHLMIGLVSQHDRKKGKIAIPITVSQAAETIATQYGRKVIRTKVSAQALMERALKRDVAFAGAQGGGYIFSQFLPAYDGILSFCKLLELLARAKRSMSEILAELPEYHLAHQNTYCPWEKKGLVMRKLMEKVKGREVELIDGVKIFKKRGWALVLPDSEDPVVRVYVEESSKEKAEKEVERHIEFVSKIVSSE